MSLPVIRTLWIGGELSSLERLALQSFINNGHKVHLYTYEEVSGVPKRIEIKDGNKILPSDRIFEYESYDTPAGFADVFRFKLLLERGGIWVDTDVVCLRPFDFEDDHVFASERLRPRKRRDFLPRTQVASCVIKAPKGSSVLSYCYDVAIEKDWDKIKYGEIGPELMTEAVDRFQMSDQVLPYWKFCPIDWWEWDRFIDDSIQTRGLEEVKRIVLRPYAYHLWNELWRRNEADKDKNFDASTIYERLKREHFG